MSMQGRIVTAVTLTLGSNLAQDAAAGATSITLEDSADFLPGPGTAVLTTDDDVTTETITYTDVDDETGVLTLSTGLVNAWTAGVRVNLDPITQDKVALVRVGDESDTVEAHIPHNMWPLVAEGVRDPGTEESVTIDQVAGEWTLIDLYGQAPVIDGTYIDPTTLPSTPTSDGNPPDSSPTPSVTSGIGTIFVQWTQVLNADPVTYDVHVSTTSDFTPTSATLVGSGMGAGPVVVRALPTGGVVTPGTTYYFKIVARDVDGSADPGTQASGTTIQAVDPNDFAQLQSDLATAQDDIATAQSTADGALTAANGKNKVYYQASAPTGGTYVTGDTWFDTDDGNKLYQWNGSTWVATQFGTSALAADSVTSTQIATGAVTSTELGTGAVGSTNIATGAVTSTQLASSVNTSISTAQTTADSKAKVTVSNTAPASPAVGDVWQDTTTTPATTKAWNGSTWVAAGDATAQSQATAANTAAGNAQATANAAQTAATTAQTTADGKNKVFYSASAPTASSPGRPGDIWFVQTGSPAQITGQYVCTAGTGTGSGNTWLSQQVTNSVIATLDAGKITTGTLDANRIAADSITSTQIAANAITASELNAGAVVAGKIAAGGVVAGNIEAHSVTANEIAANTITANEIAAGAIGTNEINANYVYAGDIAVNQLTGGQLAAEVILGGRIATADTGARVDMSALGITVYDASNIPTTNLPSDAGSSSSFKGDVEATGLTVTNGATLRSTMNEISRASSLTLAEGLTPSQTPPSVVVDWEWLDLDSSQYGDFSPVSATHTTDGKLLVTLNGLNANVGVVRFLKFNYDGTFYADLGTFTSGHSVLSGTQITSTGDFYTVASYYPEFIIQRFTPGSGSATASATYSVQNTTYNPCIGNDGTNLLLCEFNPTGSSGTYIVRTISPSTLAVTSTWTSAGLPTVIAGAPGSVLKGNFDFGASKYVITLHGLYGPTSTLVFNATTAARESNNEFDTAAGGMLSTVWDGTRFWDFSAGGRLSKHTNIKLSGSSQTLYAGYTWARTSSGYETQVSTSKSFNMYSRARMTVTSTAINDMGGASDPQNIGVYVGTSAGAMYRQGYSATGVPSFIVNSALLTSTLPPSVGNFPISAAADIHSSSGGFIVKGDGSGAWPYIQNQITTQINTAQSTVENEIHAAVPAGVIQMYGGATAPSGWLLCDGSAVSRTTYSALYAILGTAYGSGNGSTTFNLPNLTGRFPLGGGTGVDGVNRFRGWAGGQMGHAHNLSSNGWALANPLVGAIGAARQTVPSYNEGVRVSGTQSTPVNGVSLGVPLAGATDDSGNILPPALAVNFIIRTGI